MDLTSLERTLIEDVLVWVGTLLYIYRAVPYLVHLRRTGKVEEGSEFTLNLLIVSGVWWIAYSIEIDNVPTLLSTAAGMIAPAYCLWVLQRKGRLPKESALLLVAGIALLPIVLFHPREVAVGATVVGAIVTVPQTITLLRRGHLAGIGLQTWLVSGANAVIWLIYGVMIGHPMVGAAAVAMIPCSIAVTAGVLRDRRREKATL